MHFNPRRRSVPGVPRRLDPRLPRLSNFGDLLGPLVVAAMRQELGLSDRATQPGRRLLAVGSIIKMSGPGDVVWGSGVNGKSLSAGAGPALDVRAVRGPRTRRVLQDAGTQVPEIYGDPGLLVGMVWPRSSVLDPRRQREVVCVPNFRDVGALRADPQSVTVVDPLDPVADVVAALANASLVVGSSLHAIVVAEAYGVPARLVRSAAEPSFKYDDYYRGTGRPGYRAAESVAQAIEMGGEAPLAWDPGPLKAAFPAELWQR